MIVTKKALLAAVAVSGLLLVTSGTAQADTHTCSSGNECSVTPSGSEGNAVGSILTDDSSRKTTMIKIGDVGTDTTNHFTVTGTNNSTSVASVQGTGSTMNNVFTNAVGDSTAKAQAGSTTPVSVGLAAPPAGSIVHGVLPTTEPAAAAVNDSVSASALGNGYASATTLGINSDADSFANGSHSVAFSLADNGGSASADAENGSLTRLASATAVADDGAIAVATATRTGGSGAIANASGQGVIAVARDTNLVRSATVSSQTGNHGNTCGIGGGGHAFARVVDGGGDQFSSC
jgi:hypothetical protein